MLWMIDTQRARRNLNEVDSILLAQKKTAILAEKAREKQLKRLKQNRSVQMDKTEKTINVREETAKEAGVSTGTIARFEQIQKKKPELIDNIRMRINFVLFSVPLLYPPLVSPAGSRYNLFNAVSLGIYFF